MGANRTFASPEADLWKTIISGARRLRRRELQLTSLAFLTEKGIGRVELRCRQNRWQRQMTTREACELDIV
jgi:hypothetical protein